MYDISSIKMFHFYKKMFHFYKNSISAVSFDMKKPAMVTAGFKCGK